MARPPHRGSMDEPRPWLSPIQRDVLGLFAPMAVLLLAIALSVAFGLDLSPGAGLVFAPWALALMGLALLLFAGSVVWWYYVAADEREPARGEFTRDPARGRLAVREGAGTFRTKALAPEAMNEPHRRMEAEADFVPRTQRAWALWFASLIGAVVVAAVLVRLGEGSGDPLAFSLAAAGLLGYAVMAGAVMVGEFGHSGRWTRDPRARPKPPA